MDWTLDGAQSGAPCPLRDGWDLRCWKSWASFPPHTRTSHRELGLRLVRAPRVPGSGGRLARRPGPWNIASSKFYCSKSHRPTGCKAGDTDPTSQWDGHLRFDHHFQSTTVLLSPFYRKGNRGSRTPVISVL